MKIDDIINFPPFPREIYQGSPNDKPNDHCNWNSTLQFWEENDAHYRKRLKECVNEQQ